MVLLDLADLSAPAGLQDTRDRTDLRAVDTSGTLASGVAARLRRRTARCRPSPGPRPFVLGQNTGTRPTPRLGHHRHPTNPCAQAATRHAVGSRRMVRRTLTRAFGLHSATADLAHGGSQWAPSPSDGAWQPVSTPGANELRSRYRPSAVGCSPPTSAHTVVAYREP